MTIKVVMLKSGEDVICELEEMVVNERIVGYFFNYPCSVKLLGNEPTKDRSRSPFKLRLTPWAPLSKDQKIPVVMDWVISIMEPIDDLLDMYTTSIQDYEQRQSQTTSSTDESDSTDSD
jgi:hypothetical protein